MFLKALTLILVAANSTAFASLERPKTSVLSVGNSFWRAQIEPPSVLYTFFNSNRITQLCGENTPTLSNSSGANGSSSNQNDSSHGQPFYMKLGGKTLLRTTKATNRDLTETDPKPIVTPTTIEWIADTSTPLELRIDNDISLPAESKPSAKSPIEYWIAGQVVLLKINDPSIACLLFHHKAKIGARVKARAILSEGEYQRLSLFYKQFGEAFNSIPKEFTQTRARAALFGYYLADKLEDSIHPLNTLNSKQIEFMIGELLTTDFMHQNNNWIQDKKALVVNFPVTTNYFTIDTEISSEEK